MGLLVSAYPPHYPSGWHIWSYHACVASFPAFGFSGEVGDVNRFGARYRVAKSFCGIELDGYGMDTIRGYEALLKVFLMWSAVEQFQKILGIDRKGLDNLVQGYDSRSCVARIRTCDKEDRYFKFINDRLDTGKQQEELGNYLGGRPCNISYLASSIRHIFVHGPLTPNAEQTKPEVVRNICDQLFDFFMNVMDREFQQRMIAFDQEFGGGRCREDT